MTLLCCRSCVGTQCFILKINRMHTGFRCPLSVLLDLLCADWHSCRLLLSNKFVFTAVESGEPLLEGWWGMPWKHEHCLEQPQSALATVWARWKLGVINHTRDCGSKVKLKETVNGCLDGRKPEENQGWNTFTGSVILQYPPTPTTSWLTKLYDNI